MSRIQISQKQNSDNQRIIEEWMKRNNSGKIIIESDKVTGISSQNTTQNERRSLPTISIAKRTNGSESITKSNLPLNKIVNTKRNLTQSNVIRTKIARWSAPTVSIKIEPANKTVVPKSEEKNSCSYAKPSIILKKVPKSMQLSNCLESKLLDQSSLTKICAPTNIGTINGKNPIVKKNIKNPQLENQKDVYSRIRDNYKYLLTPKHWSVTEIENDSCEQYTVFSKPHVVNENGKLITVMQKSLVIDITGTIHYSVHGLPVDVEGTILPDVLDNIKKLLSIVHIFDKMQVCKGLGDDLLIVKTDNLLKDSCQVWRHTNCKLLLVKADQCQICLDRRNILLEKEMLFKSEVLSTESMNIKIKEEVN